LDDVPNLIGGWSIFLTRYGDNIIADRGWQTNRPAIIIVTRHRLTPSVDGGGGVRSETLS
jgi:hypothetical protein